MFTDRFKELVSTRGEMAKVEAGTGIDSGLLSKYKNGRVEPTLPNAVAIADYFDVSLDWLAGRDGYERDSHKRPSPALAPDVAGLVDDYNSTTTQWQHVIAEQAAHAAKEHPKTEADRAERRTA